MASLLINLGQYKKSLKIIKVAFISLLQHKLRAALSILGVICGVMAVLSMLSIGEGAKRESLAQIEQLGTKNIYVKSVSLTVFQEKKAKEKDSRGLTVYDGDRIINECRNVQDVASLSELKASIYGVVKDITPQIIACSPNYADVQKLFMYHGRFISDRDMDDKNQVCVIGNDVATKLGFQGNVGNYLRIENGLFKIIGILKRFDIKTTKSSVINVRNYNDMVFIPLTTSCMFNKNASMNNGDPQITELVIRMKRADDVIKSLAVIKRTMEVSHGGAEDYQIVAPQELLRQSQKVQRTFSIVLGSIAFISLLIGGIGIMNIMLATVSERTREIGIRRALGATQTDIIMQFLTESIILTFSGGIIGIIAGLGGVFLISAIAKWNTAITALSLLLPLATSIFIGIFFGLYPAYLAAKMDPISALRRE